jgi:hypothetical protein
MEFKPNSFALRGESGLVKIDCDSVFTPGSAGPASIAQADCDITVESNGFRVNKVLRLGMARICAFLGELKEVVSRRSGIAWLQAEQGELSLKFICEGSERRIECAVNDANEGKANSVQVEYPIEPSYFEELKQELGLER